MHIPDTHRLGKEAYEITCGNSITIIHYNSILLYKVDGDTYLGDDWTYSRTSTRLITNFLGITKKDVINRLNNGFYKILNR